MDIVEWAKKVKERDGICQICDSVIGLEAHHILPFRWFTKLSLIPNNGITLCHDCHAETSELNWYRQTEQSKHYEYYYD